MRDISNWIQTGLFLAFIGVFFVINLFTPDRGFSENENRALQQAPPVSLQRIANKSFMDDFEKYMSDQFAARDLWMSSKARMELLSGKREMNNVYLCSDGRLLERFELPTDETFTRHAGYITEFADRVDLPVYFALIPSALEFGGALLPDGAPYDGQKQLIDAFYNRDSKLQNIDIFAALAEHSDEYIYYRTDHHWTSLGAYYAYSAISDAMSLSCPPLDSYVRRKVSAEFYGSLYSSSGMNWVPADEIELFVEPDSSVQVFKYGSAGIEPGPLYRFEALEKKDKYSLFMGGIAGLSRVETGTADSPTLLIIRDSFADSLVPFLLEDFAEIHLVDLRYYTQSLSAYIEDVKPDVILICYSVVNFSSDTHLFQLLG